MAVLSYRTIARASEGLYKEKASKFIAFAFPVTNEQEIRMHLAALKKRYFDAHHHCFAWMLGPERKHFRAFDDGEPNHSAGDPIIGQIRARNLTDVLVVVVRYFGGTKLGVGGLIAAYKAAAEHVLTKAEIIEKEVEEEITLRYDYSASPEVMRMVKELGLKIVHQDFSERCVITVSVALRNKAQMFLRLKLLQDLRIPIAWDLNEP